MGAKPPAGPAGSSSSAPTSAAGKLQGSELERHERENTIAADWRAFSGETQAGSSSAANRVTNKGMWTDRFCMFELIKAGGT